MLCYSVPVTPLQQDTNSGRLLGCVGRATPPSKSAVSVSYPPSAAKFIRRPNCKHTPHPVGSYIQMSLGRSEAHRNWANYTKEAHIRQKAILTATRHALCGAFSWQCCSILGSCHSPYLTRYRYTKHEWPLRNNSACIYAVIYTTNTKNQRA